MGHRGDYGILLILATLTICPTQGIEYVNKSKDVILVNGESHSVTCDINLFDLDEKIEYAESTLVLLRKLDLSAVEESMAEMNMSRNDTENGHQIYIGDKWNYTFNYENLMIASTESVDCADSGLYVCMVYHRTVFTASKPNSSYYLKVTARPLITSMILMNGILRKGRSFKYYNKLLCTAEGGAESSLSWFTMCYTHGTKEIVQGQVKTVKTSTEITRNVPFNCKRTYFSSTFSDMYPDTTKVCNITCCVHTTMSNFSNLDLHDSECKHKLIQELKVSSARLDLSGKMLWFDAFLVSMVVGAAVFGTITISVLVLKFGDSERKTRFKTWKDELLAQQRFKQKKSIQKWLAKNKRHRNIVRVAQHLE